MPQVEQSSTSVITRIIGDDIVRYKNIYTELFKSFPACENLNCVEKQITNGMKTYAQEKKKSFVYKIEYPSNLKTFKRKFKNGLDQLIESIENDTRITTATSNEVMDGDNYQSKEQFNVLKPVVSKVEFVPFYTSDSLGFIAKVSISHQSHEVCAQYYKGPKDDETLEVRFARLRFKGKEVQLLEHEVTNALYQKIIPSNQRIQGCSYDKADAMPATCIDDKMVVEFIRALNQESTSYRYRLPRCSEWKFIATCNKKVKFCWGNSKAYQNFENLRVSRYGFEVKKVKSYQKNQLQLFDLCGNAEELCRDRRNRLKISGTNRRFYTPTIESYAPGRSTGLRLLREKKK